MRFCTASIRQKCSWLDEGHNCAHILGERRRRLSGALNIEDGASQLAVRPASPVKRWLPILGSYFGGQSSAQALNLATALLLLRILPVSEYALYILANVLVTVGSVGSDLGLSSAVTTFGSRLVDNRHALSRLYASALRLRRWLFVLTSTALLLGTPFILGRHGWPLLTLCGCLVLVLTNNWVQQTNGLRTAVFNVHHDSAGLAHASIGAGLTRLVLTAVVCRYAPYANVALLINVLGIVFSNSVLRNRGRRYLDDSQAEDRQYTAMLRTFAYPLVARTIYFIFQGSISLLLIGFFGVARSIAEVGALSRLSQVMTVLVMFNSFLFHPAFSRAPTKAVFLRRLGMALCGMGLLLAAIQTSAFLLPDWWLLLLGGKYSSLRAEVPLAVAGAVAEYLGEFLFIVLLSRAFTRGQFWYIAITVLVEIAFVSLVGADTTHRVIWLNLANRIAIVLVQLALLLVLLRSWDEHEARDTSLAMATASAS